MSPQYLTQPRIQSQIEKKKSALLKQSLKYASQSSYRLWESSFSVSLWQIRSRITKLFLSLKIQKKYVNVKKVVIAH